MTGVSQGPSAIRAMSVGGLATVVCLMPSFLVGAMAVQLMDDLQFGPTGLGAAVSLFFSGSALTSVHMGRLADRLGAIWSLRLSIGMSVVLSLGIAATVTSWGQLAVWLFLGGCAAALVQPAANRMLVHVVRPERLGLGFGVKQSAPPTAAMLAGLSVPAVALTLGWRWGYVLTAALGLIAVIAVGRRAPASTRPRVDRGQRGKLRNPGRIFLFSTVLGLATVGSASTTAFYVEAAVRAGSSPQLAGTLLAVASLSAVTVRIVAGLVSDFIVSGHLRLCAGLLAVGATGFLLLPTGRPGLMAAGVLIALAGTWGQNGVFWFALVREYADMPGRATGALFPGGLVGVTAGPVLFGVIVDTLSYTAAWLFAFSTTLVAAIAMFVGARWLGTGPLAHRVAVDGQPRLSWPAATEGMDDA